MRILGIDYGNKKIGLAISDRSGRIAYKFTMIINNSQKESVKKIKKIVEEKNIKEIVIGIPFGLKRKSAQTFKTESFARNLKCNINIPVVKLNEIYTTKIAKKNLKESGMKNINNFVDQESARIILQDYIEKIVNK